MKKLIFLFFILIILLFFSIPVYAGGKQEDKLDQVRELIEQKKYNEALILIAEVIQEDPDRFDEAVELSNKINSIMIKYNEKYEELIVTLYDEQDVEKGLKLIAELEELNPNPNVQTADTVELAKEGASLVANLNYFEEIMEKAHTLLNEREFSNAVLEYKKGFISDPPLDLHRSEYEAVEFGTIVETDLNNAFETLIALSDSFIQEGTELIKKTDEILTAVSFLNNEIDVPSTLDLLDNLITFSEYNTSIEKASLFIKSQNDKLKERTDSGRTILFLKYSYQLVMGSDSSGETEGISYAINKLIDTLSMGIDDTYVKEALEFLEQGKTSYFAENYEQAKNFFNVSLAIIKQELPVAYFIDLRQRLSPEYRLQTLGNWLIQDEVPYFMDIQESAKEILAYIYLIENLPERFAFQEIKEVPSEKQYEEMEADLKSYIDVVKILSNDWDTYTNERSEKSPVTFDTSRAESIIELCADKAALFIKEELKSLSLMYENIKKSYEQEKKLLENGIEHEQYEVVFYPDERIRNFKKLTSILSFVSRKLETIMKEWESEGASGSEMRRTVNDAKGLYENVKYLAAAIASKQGIAENYIFKAEKEKDLGNIRYDEAQIALKRQDFIRTESKIKEASSAFLSSLSYQEDDEVRRTYAQLQILARTMEKEKNAVAIKEYRKLMEEGKDYYAKGLYEEAYDAFIQAQEAWESSKSEANPENEDWLAYVQAALTIESARTINETDPLYKEMSQLFNLAKDDYNEGVQLLIQGKKEEAFELFKRAEEKLIIITKQFPYNNDARLLKLYILKEKDEEGFKQTFSERLGEAKQKITGSNQDKQEAYIDLKELAAIDPNYPGLKKMILDLEYALSIRRRLPTAAEKKKSKELTAQAKPIVINRDYDSFPQARKLLADALKLDPDNQEAKNLYDKMGVEAGSEKRIVISASDMKQYERAVQFYSSGQFIEAYNIVLELLKKKVNQGYEPLRDLEKKLKIELGIPDE